ncbi:MAG: WD40 repeat domain-containing protein [Verrucomicrobiales bacterium]|nr:WD40 repeat domain-containing protein [Verrucomicrobiales bacterium]
MKSDLVAGGTLERRIPVACLVLGLGLASSFVRADVVRVPERVLGLGYVHSVAVSPDGSGILVGGVQAQWFDLATGELRRQFVGHTNTVQAVAFSPEGSRVATGGEDTTVILWDAPTGQVRWRLTGHARGVRALAFSPDGARLVTGGVDKTARVWDVTTGNLERSMTIRDRPGSETIVSVGFSADGRSILTAVAGGSFAIWNADTGELRSEVETGASLLNVAALAPDATRVAVSVGDSLAPLVQIWDVAAGTRMHALTGHSNVISSLSFTSDGKTLLTGSWDKTVRRWDVTTGAWLPPGVQIGDTDQALAITADGRRFATGGALGVKVWDFATGELLRSLEGHVSALTTARWSPSGDLVLTGDSRGRVSLWEVATGRLVRTFNVPEASLASADFSPDGETLLLAVHPASGGSRMELWDARSGQFLRTVGSSPVAVWEAQFSPDGSRIAAAGGRAYVWATSTGQEEFAFPERGLPLYALAWAPDGSWLAAGGAGKIVRRWDLATGEERGAFEGHLGPVDDIAVSRDGTRVATTASNDPNVLVWDVLTGAKARSLGLGLGVSTVDFSPDGSLLLTGSQGSDVSLSAIDDGVVLRSFEAHSLGISVAAFSPDGSRVLTVGGDRVGLVWNVSELMDSVVWRIRAAKVEAGRAHLVVRGRLGGGARLAIEATTDLTNPASWAEVLGATLTSRAEGGWDVVVDAREPVQFLRARAVR